MNLLGNPLDLLRVQPHRRRRFVRAACVAFALTGVCVAGVCRPARADSWALLIGIDEYPAESGVNRLQGAANDARALARTLQDTLKIPADHIHVLTSDGAVKPTKDNIEAELDWLASKSKTLDPTKDVIFVSYSGHGMTDDQTREPYLITYNARKSGDTNRLLFKTSLRQHDFEDALLELPAHALFLVYDMCRENVTKEVRPGARTGPAEKNTLTDAQLQRRGTQTSAAPNNTAAPHSANEPQVVATFWACSRGGYSYEMPGLNRGYFSYFLEQGLRGYAATDQNQKDGRVSINVLNKYLAKVVPEAMEKDHPNSTPQVPFVQIAGPGDAGDFVVVTVNLSTLKGIKTASVKMQQALDLVPELIQSAAVNARVALLPVYALMEVWQAQRKAGDTEGAKQSLASAKQIAGTISDADEKAASLCDIAVAQAKAGDVSGARQIVGIIENVYRKARPLRFIAQAQAKAGDIVGAKQTAGTIERNVNEKVYALCDVAEAQAKADDTEGAKQTCLIAKQTADTIPNSLSEAKADVLRFIAEVQAKVGDIVGAKQTASSTTSAFDKFIALRLIAQVQTKAGDMEGAKRTLAIAKQAAETIMDSTSKAFALSANAEAQLKAGDTEGAKQTFTAARQMADDIADTDHKTYALYVIAEAQARAGDINGAKQTLAIVKQISGSPEGEFFKVNALVSIAEAQARTGDFVSANQTFAIAKKTAGDLENSFSKAHALGAIAEAQTNGGDFIGAEATIDEITDAGEKAKALAQLASAILDAARKESDDAQKQAAPAPTAAMPPAPPPPAKTP